MLAAIAAIFIGWKIRRDIKAGKQDFALGVWEVIGMFYLGSNALMLLINYVGNIPGAYITFLFVLLLIPFGLFNLFIGFPTPDRLLTISGQWAINPHIATLAELLLFALGAVSLFALKLKGKERSAALAAACAGLFIISFYNLFVGACSHPIGDGTFYCYSPASPENINAVIGYFAVSIIAGVSAFAIRQPKH